MSSIARWSYKNTATIRPFLGTVDRWSGAHAYGEPYEIACNWIAESMRVNGDDGQEFVSRHTYYTEDPRPKFMDQIQQPGSEIWEEIRVKTSWDMNMFNDTLDFKLIAGLGTNAGARA